MSIAKEMKNIQDTVLELLKLDMKYRDSDRVLCCKIWSMQMGELRVIKEMSAYDLLCEYSQPKSKLTNVVSIVRVRRRIQKENKELRGTKYKGKNKEAEEVKEFLGYH
jgi:hypothetical protein|tara:strand:- start:162 stop:485 length:324 start_codon:yes stop_codon:yes gene_type:complete